MKDLYEERLKRMNDDELLDECLRHGKALERGSLSDGDKIRATTAFKAAVSRPTLKDHHDVLLTALRVMRYL